MPTPVFEQIIECIQKNFDIAPDAEITLEANPGTLDKTRLHEFMAAGVNRLSVGVQSLDDAELELLGRTHTARDAINLIDAACRMGLRVSGDFIYGLPGQDAHAVEKICRQINDLGLRHCSMYELTIEPSTPFGRMNLDMPSNDEMADMYSAIGATLNLPRYEVSNYAAPTQHCRHNENIWDGAPYIGIGRGAAGRIFMGDQWFEQMGAGARFEPMSAHDRAIEKIITGMRTMRGVELSPDVVAAVDWDAARANADFVKWDNNRMQATEAGLLTLDNLLIKLIG